MDGRTRGESKKLYKRLLEGTETCLRKTGILACPNFGKGRKSLDILKQN